MDYLKELYAGNIFPADSHAETDPAYRDASCMYVRQYTTLQKHLNGKMLQELERLNDQHNLLLSMQDEAAFKLGFRLGVQMMCACLHTSPPGDKP